MFDPSTGGSKSFYSKLRFADAFKVEGRLVIQVAEASVKAFVFLNVEPGQSAEVLKELIQVEGVSTCYLVLGIYDVVAVVESSSVEELKAVVQEKIRKIDYVRASMTTIVA